MRMVSFLIYIVCCDLYLLILTNYLLSSEARAESMPLSSCFHPSVWLGSQNVTICTCPAVSQRAYRTRSCVAA